MALDEVSEFHNKRRIPLSLIVYNYDTTTKVYFGEDEGADKGCPFDA